MTDHFTGPELFVDSCGHLDDIAEGEADYESASGKHVDNRMLYATIANARATQALTAAVVMLAENHGAFPPYEVDAWREVVPFPPLPVCRSKDARRPACAERHTDDCPYVDPIPKPKHVLLAVGTRVLVSPLHYPDCTCASTQPYVGKIAGYDDSRSKYRINEECYGRPGEYYDFVKWEFTTNRVEVHPDGPDYTKPEPTGPRVYVQGGSGVQGYIIGTGTDPDRGPRIKVHWLEPGGPETWVGPASVGIITDDEVARCENGQDGEECGEGENRCELCLAAEDAEAEAIEESMGL